MKPKALRILVITPWYAEQDPGGVAVTVENLVHGLTRLDVEPIVLKIVGEDWCPRITRGQQQERIWYLPIRPRSQAAKPKPFLGYWLRFPIVWLTLALLLLVFRPDIVHFQYYAEEYEDLRKIVRAFRKRVVTTFHGSDIMVGVNDTVLKKQALNLINDSSRVLTVSKALQSELHRKFPEAVSKSYVISNAIDKTFLDAVLKDGRSSSPDLDLLFVGGLIPVKGSDLLLEAFVQIVKERPKTTLCLIGVGPLERELKARIRSLKLDQNVTLLGSVAHTDLIQWYGRTRIVVIPSRSEGLSLVSIEAAVMGKPVVAFNVGGISEVVIHGKTGIVVPPNEPNELAHGLLDMLERSDLSEEMGNQARVIAMQLYGPETLAKKYYDLYVEVLGEGESKNLHLSSN